MRITFHGWRRYVLTHTHAVVPMRLDGHSYYPVPNRKSLAWTDAMTAFGKLEGLGLSCDFHVEFKFNEAELKNWLTQYISANPKRALRR